MALQKLKFFKRFSITFDAFAYLFILIIMENYKEESRDCITWC